MKKERDKRSFLSVAHCFDVYNEVRILFFGCHCRFDECGKYRVGDFGTRCKFGVELYAHEEGVIAHFNGFDDTTVGGFAAYHEAAFFKRFEIVRVELVSVAVSFFDDVLICVGFFDFRAVFEGAGVCAEAHRSADSLALFVGKNVDDVTAAFGKLAARCVLDAEYVTGVFDDGDLHAEAYAEIGDFVFTSIFARANHSLDASCAEAARDDDSVHVFEFVGNVLVGDGFAVHPLEIDACFVRSACVLDCFDERNVGIAQRNVFAYYCDSRFYGFDFEICDFLFPLCQIALAVERERFAYCFVQTVTIEHRRCVVEAFYGGARHDGLLVYRAEKRNLFDYLFRRILVRARDHDVGEYAEALEFAHGVLHRFGLKFVRARHIQEQTDVY